MKIFALGLNHEKASLEEREAYALPEEKQREFLKEATSLPHMEELVLLSTCNRVEFYGVSRHPKTVAKSLLRFLHDYLGLPDSLLVRSDELFYFHENEAAVSHGFAVASSLNSMVLGEVQILGQFKAAYTQASQVGTVGRFLHKYFHEAFRVAKTVRTETSIGEQPVSLSYAAVRLAKQIFGELSGKRVLVLGAGKMSELTLKHLRAAGLEKIFVANRNTQRAQKLAHRFFGEAIPFENFERWLRDVDLVISSTNAPYYLVDAEKLQSVRDTKKSSPLFFIDLAVPRDVSPDINDLSNVFLYDLDDLGQVVSVNQKQRQQEAKEGFKRVEEASFAFKKVLASLEAAPTLGELKDKFEKLTQLELQKALEKLSHLAPKDKQVIETLVRSIVNKALHDPMVVLKEESSQVGLGESLNLLRRLFKLDEEGGL